MEVKISRTLAERLGEDKLRQLGKELRDRFHEEYTVNLADLTKVQVDKLREWLEDEAFMNVRGPKVIIRDIDNWKKAIQDAGPLKARTLQQFSSIVTQYLLQIPGHRLYERLDIEGLAYIAFYVNDVTFHAAIMHSNHRQPAYVEITLLHIELGGRRSTTISLHAEDVQGKTASEVLVRQGYFPETPELREAYLDETSRFMSIAENVGQQFLAVGFGTDDLDGNENTIGRAWATYGRNRMPMVRDDRPSKVVMDVYFESDKERRNQHGASVDLRFWDRKSPKMADPMDEEDDVLKDTDVSIEEPVEVPVHPFCATFDLRRHTRMKIHINYLTEYVYDQSIGDSLILPDVTKNLVATLIEQNKVNFTDIIEGKGAGVCVLLTGVPGVGKTLTAEVFAEASGKPLYSIQAAQLGIDAARLEQNLTRFLARGSRWGAVILIDEADVYIRERDRNMDHNAIVAAFLRILEYQTSVLFMTTNLPDQVDDAIASRCVARIDYDVPDLDQQERIWKVLNKANETGLCDEDITLIALKHDTLTGRDIKQLLKLASLVAQKRDEAITPETIDFVSQFRPTRGKETHKLYHGETKEGRKLYEK